MRWPVVVVLLLLAPWPSGLAAQGGTPLENALAFLASQRDDDGGYHPFLAPYVGEAVAAMGLDPKAWPDAAAPIFPSFQPYTYGGDADRTLYSYERIAHAVGSAGYDPRDVDGLDLVALIQGSFHDGQFGRVEWVNDDAWAILALRAAGVPSSDAQIQAAAAFIELARCQDGGWSYAVAPRHEKPGAFSPVSNTDVTGMVIAALAAAGRDVADDVRARRFLDATYDDATGGHRDQVVGGLGVTAASTVWALQGYRAMGLPDRPTSLGFVHSLQAEEGGFRNGPTAAPDVMTTADVVVLLAGGTYPVASRGGEVTASVGPALEPSLFATHGPFTRVVWRFSDGAEVEGARVHHTFAAAGLATYAVEAEGSQLRLREAGTIVVPTARPTLTLPSDIEALRNIPVVLRPEASDPDGAIVGFETVWGDGTTSFALEHAYATPGERVVTVRARDDDGAWSRPATTVVHVRNRAPLLEGTPTTVLADRAHDVELAASARDPEGDDVHFSWRLGNVSIDGPTFRHRFAQLGDHTLDLVAQDAFGGEATAQVTVTVQNLPPVLADLTLPASARAGEPFAFSVRASDPDGAPPRVRWTLGSLEHEGLGGNARLAEGEHRVVVTARDDDGGERSANASLRVVAVDEVADATPTSREVDESPSAQSSVEALSPPLEPLPELRFLHPPRNATVGEVRSFSVLPLDEATAYRFELGDGNSSDWSSSTLATHTWARPGAYEVRAYARAADGRTTSVAWIAHVTMPTPPSAIRDAALPAGPGTPARAVDALEASALTTPEGRQEAPLPGVLAILGLLLAARGRRARRA